MADMFSRVMRSEIMARVKSRGNKATEQRLISIMREHGVSGWRRNTAVFGKPDFVFPKQRLAVFVDGCFWHSCPQHGTAPATNVDFWTAKLERNAKRDRLVNRTLAKAGWKVIRIWQHTLKDRKSTANRLSRLVRKSDHQNERT